LADVAKKAVWPALIFNLSIEPAFKFNLCVFGDKSNDVQSRTSYLTQKQVIYLETEKERFEICRKDVSASAINSDSKAKEDKAEGEQAVSPSACLYTFSRVQNPEKLDNEFFALPSTKIPLDSEHKTVLEDDLDWHDFIWSDHSLVLKNKTYEQLANFKLYDIKYNS